MIFHRIIFTATVIVATSAGLVSCQSTSTPRTTPVLMDNLTPSALIAATATVPAPTDNPALTLWLPAVFRPDSNSSGGKVLQDRIAAFEKLHPGVSITIRIKDLAGTGGMLDSLAAASSAAPGALPDLVALDQSNLRAAAIKGLIFPLDQLLPPNSWDSDYPYALSMAAVGSSRSGLPFAGDATILADTQPAGAGPETWDQTADRTSRVFFPLGDSRSLFLFFEYYAAGGITLDSLTDAALEKGPLEKELAWLAALQKKEVLSPRSLQIDSFENAFLSIQNYGEASASLYSLTSLSKGFSMNYLPTPDGSEFSLGTGWSWAIAATDPIRRARAAELMLWLSDPAFLAQWTQAQGVLPATRDILALWPASARRDFVAGLSEQALLFPEDEISNSFGPVFSKAAHQVLAGGIAAATAASEAAQVAGP